MKSNKSTIIWVVAIVLVLGGLLAWPKLNDPNKGIKKTWAAASVECLPNGHTQLAQHIHPRLAIKINGEEFAIPANVGVINGCMAEMHTHDGTGVIHLETRDLNKKFTLSKFFAVWNRPLEIEGQNLKVTANGKLMENPKELILEDKQEILLEYSKTK